MFVENYIKLSQNASAMPKRQRGGVSMAITKIERADGSYVDCDLEGHTLSYYRYHVHFTDSEWLILKTLYEHRGEVVPRSDLVKLIWGDGSEKEPTRTVDVHISSVRKKLAYIRGARIDSVYGKGYKLIMLKRF